MPTHVLVGKSTVYDGVVQMWEVASEQLDHGGGLDGDEIRLSAVDGGQDGGSELLPGLRK